MRSARLYLRFSWIRRRCGGSPLWDGVAAGPVWSGSAPAGFCPKRWKRLFERSSRILFVGRSLLGQLEDALSLRQAHRLESLHVACARLGFFNEAVLSILLKMRGIRLVLLRRSTPPSSLRGTFTVGCVDSFRHLVFHRSRGACCFARKSDTRSGSLSLVVLLSRSFSFGCRLSWYGRLHNGGDFERVEAA